MKLTVREFSLITLALEDYKKEKLQDVNTYSHIDGAEGFIERSQKNADDAAALIKKLQDNIFKIVKEV